MKLDSAMRSLLHFHYIKPRGGSQVKGTYNIATRIRFNEMLAQEDEEKLAEALRIILDIKHKQITKGETNTV